MNGPSLMAVHDFGKTPVCTLSKCFFLCECGAKVARIGIILEKVCELSGRAG